MRSGSTRRIRLRQNQRERDRRSPIPADHGLKRLLLQSRLLQARPCHGTAIRETAAGEVAGADGAAVADVKVVVMDHRIRAVQRGNGRRPLRAPIDKAVSMTSNYSG